MKKIIQWNINEYSKNYEQLQIILKQHKPTILSLQETNFKNEHHPIVKGYANFTKNRKNTNHASGGTTIAIAGTVIATEIPLTTNLEAIVVAVSLPNSLPLHLQELKDLINQIPPPMLIVDDFN